MQALQIYCIDLEHHQACDRDLKYLSSVVVPIECHFRYRQRLQVIIRDQKSLNKKPFTSIRSRIFSSQNVIIPSNKITFYLVSKS